jgi:hypothetical protein
MTYLLVRHTLGINSVLVYLTSFTVNRFSAYACTNFSGTSRNLGVTRNWYLPPTLAALLNSHLRVDCELLYDRSDLSTGRTPHDKQSRNCLDYSQNLVMSPGGAQCQDWLTDWLTDRLSVGLKVSLTLFMFMKSDLPQGVEPLTVVRTSYISVFLCCDNGQHTRSFTEPW